MTHYKIDNIKVNVVCNLNYIRIIMLPKRLLLNHGCEGKTCSVVQNKNQRDKIRHIIDEEPYVYFWRKQYADKCR